MNMPISPEKLQQLRQALDEIERHPANVNLLKGLVDQDQPTPTKQEGVNLSQYTESDLRGGDDNDSFDNDEYVHAREATASPRRLSPDKLGLSARLDSIAYDEIPAFRLPKAKTIIALSMAATAAGAVVGGLYDEQVKNPQMVIAQLPFINTGYTPEEDAMLNDCVGDKIGNLVFQANIDAVQPETLPPDLVPYTGKVRLVQAGMEWNVPKEDGTIGPPLSKSLMDKPDHDDNPDTPVVEVTPRHPQILVGQTTGYVGVCDNEGDPAITISGAEDTNPTAKINLSKLNLRLVLEKQADMAEVEAVDSLTDPEVIKGIMSKEIADGLFASMKDPANADIAAANTLHVAGKMIAAPGSETAEQIKAEAIASLPDTINQLLAEQQPGVTYTIEIEEGLRDIIPVGTSEVSTDKFQLIETTLAPDISITNIAKPKE